jgi:hypothetical protein
MRDRMDAGCMWEQRRCHGFDSEMVKVFRVDFDCVAVIGWLTDVDIRSCGGAFCDQMTGVLREVDSDALRGAFGDEIAAVPREVDSGTHRGAFEHEYRGADRGVVGDRLVDSLVSGLPFLVPRVDLELVRTAGVPKV